MIKNKELWLRNTRCMNDYSEMNHGLDCLVNSFTRTDSGEKLQKSLNFLFDGFVDNFTKEFNKWLPIFTQDSYISCFSIHPKEEDNYGRLSMWRAYGGENPVAIVFNPEVFYQETNAFNAYTYPVIYRDTNSFQELFDGLTSRIYSNKTYLKELGEEQIRRYLFDVFKNIIFCVKHPGFSEEREWRVVYCPYLGRSENMIEEIVSIRGVPQTIHKLPIRDIPDAGFLGADIPSLINRIIVGPTDNQNVLIQTFRSILEKEGCKNCADIVYGTKTPLRHNS